ncbi:MAG: HAMP domain-containing protein [Treponema sp.]|nr:HAMP domain-containing protein [Treponema sp.]
MSQINSETAKKVKKTSMLLLLILSIGGTIAAFNFLETVVVARSARIDIVEEDAAHFTEVLRAYSLAMENDVWGYSVQLDYYVNADVMKTGTLPEMAAWLQAHESDRSENFDYIMLAGPDGLSYNDIGSRTEISNRSYFRAIMHEGKDFFVDDPVISKTTGKSVVHITRAIKRNGKNIAMLAGVVNVDDLVEEFSQIRIGDAGYAWMLASDGTVMCHPHSEFVKQKNFITGLSAGFEAMSDVARSMVSGGEGTAWIKSPDGGTDFIVYGGVKGTTWGLALTIPQAEIYKLIVKIRTQMIVFGTIVVIFSILVGGLLLYFTIKPLNIVKDTIQGHATGNADLTKRIEVKTNNEIGQVVQGFNMFAAKLQEIIKDVKDSKSELSEAGEDMSASTQDTSSAITQIISNIEEVGNQINSQAAGVEETAGAVNEIASNIESLERMIENQSSGVAQASAAVEEMIGNIQSVNSSVDKMASSFNSLKENAQHGFSKQQDVNERIQQIEQQSSMLQEANAAISAIAEQTNLLAMNAAIEAAHAGDAGKGFAVVADEIRKLSETSTIQSKTIGEQLSNISESIMGVVTASSESSRAFEAVSGQLQSTDELVIMIKSAMEEQNEGSKQISEALQSMNNSTVEVRNASIEMAEGNKAILVEMKNLQNSALVMKDSMSQMSAGARKINETGVALNGVAEKIQGSIDKIGAQIDQFKI